MIPAQSYDLSATTVRREPSYTHRLDIDAGRVAGYTDDRAAIEQAIYKIINTERYQYAIYGAGYGIELQELFGLPLPYVYPEIKRRIAEALTADDRIQSVGDFELSNQRGTVLCKFVCQTVVGAIAAQKEVRIYV